MGRRRKQLPLLENITIIDAGAEGKAIAKHEEQIIFVSNAIPGDICDVQITKKKKRYLEGRVTRFIERSNLHQPAFCKHFGTCGGCKWQELPYEQQLFYKQKQVEDNFSRLGQFDYPKTEKILSSKKSTYYRNKLEFTFSNKRWLTKEEMEQEDLQLNALGFHVPGRFDKIVDVEHCYLQSDVSNEIKNFVRDYALKNDLSFFDIRDQHGLLRNLIIRSSSTGELMVILSFFEAKMDLIEGLLKEVKEAFPVITSLMFVVNEKKNDTLFDQDIKLFHGKDHIMEEMEGICFKIGPKSFYQTNSDQAYELYKVTRNFAEISEEDLVYDLYTGTGTIANFVAKRAKNVVGVEYVPEAIEDAKENSRYNNIENTSFYAGDMKDVLNDDFVNKNGKPDVIITDPPRAGMHPDVIDTILRLEAKRIVYVSCNPATQARDLSLLNHKYEVKKVQPVDMFPQTHHVENVVQLELRES